MRTHTIPRTPGQGSKNRRTMKGIRALTTHFKARKPFCLFQKRKSNHE